MSETKKMRLLRSLPVCALVWMLAACSTTMRPVVYRSSKIGPHVIEYESGGYASRTRFSANGVNACYEHFKWRRGPSDGNGFVLDYQTQCVPTPEDWEKFWRAVDGLQLSRWKAYYAQDDAPLGPNGEKFSVTDATSWSLTVTTLRDRKKSSGEGAYPVLGHPERAIYAYMTKTKEKDATDSLEKAFRELIGLSPYH